MGRVQREKGYGQIYEQKRERSRNMKKDLERCWPSVKGRVGRVEGGSKENLRNGGIGGKEDMGREITENQNCISGEDLSAKLGPNGKRGVDALRLLKKKQKVKNELKRQKSRGRTVHSRESETLLVEKENGSGGIRRASPPKLILPAEISYADEGHGDLRNKLGGVEGRKMQNYNSEGVLLPMSNLLSSESEGPRAPRAEPVSLDFLFKERQCY